MADNILRLKVESTGYGGKLKSVAEGLSRYIDKCRETGKTLEDGGERGPSIRVEPWTDGNCEPADRLCRGAARCKLFARGPNLAVFTCNILAKYHFGGINGASYN